jgi:hypothetical protein
MGSRRKQVTDSPCSCAGEKECMTRSNDEAAAERNRGFRDEECGSRADRRLKKAAAERNRGLSDEETRERNGGLSDEGTRAKEWNGSLSEEGTRTRQRSDKTES